jgi:hypothetical protein
VTNEQMRALFGCGLHPLAELRQQQPVPGCVLGVTCGEVLTKDHVVSVAAVPIIYAVAMGIEAVAALAITGSSTASKGAPCWPCRS